ncbi:MAG TPA: glucosyl-3-phosphoglycerate synthase [Solirubrobacterales bacterium]|jgi:glucosyl-3-phosphoglycerate synthase|nr:glucosyl-3-phosphoglycerate synthase [Solirubrobacterales bacterium]
MLATFDHHRYEVAALRALKRETVSVCIPARETAATIGATVAAVGELREAGLVDQLLVVDAASEDGTAELARAAGAEVLQEAELLPETGPVEGKGDAMWRALSALDGELVVYLDGDVKDFGAHYVTGLLGPLLESPPIGFVKGFYRRPLGIEELEIADGGGRVTELTARPLLELFVPELADFKQPLAGECAARRDLLAEIPFLTGYGVEIGMLIEVWRRIGIERMAQVDLGSKRNSHQSLADLAQMAREVLAALVLQLEHGGEGRPGLPGASPALTRQVHRREPIASLTASGSGV